MMQIHKEIHVKHMNSAPIYNHFILGKFVENENALYQVIAHSTDLTNKEDLKTMSKRYRFWGGKSPEEKPKAVGIFLDNTGGKNLVLVKVEAAVDGNGHEVVSSDNRPFNQHHYIFIPIDVVAKQLRGRTFKLLSWINARSIPCFSQFNANLKSLEIPLLENPLPTELPQEEVNKIKRHLVETNAQEQPLLLSAIAALNNDMRLLITSDNNSTDFVESLFLLLPASVRNEVSIAEGILEEDHCNWAKLVIKINKTSRSRHIDGLIRLNYSRREFEGQFNKETAFKSDYINLIQAILNIPDTDVIPKLLKQLDSVDDNNATLKDPATVSIIIRLIQEFPQIFQQVWRLLPSTKRIQFVKELKDNFHLAKTLLLKEKLLDQPRYEAEDTVIKQELIVLCQNLVINKHQSDFQTAWQLATDLSTHKIFQANINAQFELLDASLVGKNGVEDLYNSFNCKLAPLVVNFEAGKINTSNFYKQLQVKNPKAAELLNILLTKQSSALKYLPSLVNLTKMEEVEQDNFYATVLEMWSPSYESACELLASLIAKSQGMDGNKFNRTSFIKTCAWFEEKNPELSNIFIALGQSNPTSTLNWEIWKQLANALYKNPQRTATFLDKVVGTIFPIRVLETYLPTIAKDDDLRRFFCRTSLAWKYLQSQHNYFVRLVDIWPRYATTLVRCLRDSNQLNWLDDKLLHYLCEEWIKHKHIDDDLKILVTEPATTQAFTTHTWLKLQYVFWIIDADLNLPPGRPDLEVHEKKELLNQAIKIAHGLYTQPEQKRRLLKDCEAWQLDLTQLKDILKKIADPASDFNLVLDYIGSDLQAIDPTQDIPLLFAHLSQLSSESLSLLLNERFKQNFPLAEVLLNHGLYEQPCLLKESKVKSELRTFCQRVIEYKSKQNWSQAWKLVKKIDQSTAFKDDKDRLDLLNVVRPYSKNQDKESLLEYAITIAKLYTQPEQMRCLLGESSILGLSLTEQKEILKANRQACDTDLLFEYL